MTHSWSANVSCAVNLALGSRVFEDNWPCGQERGSCPLAAQVLGS